MTTKKLLLIPLLLVSIGVGGVAWAEPELFGQLLERAGIVRAVDARVRAPSPGVESVVPLRTMPPAAFWHYDDGGQVRFIATSPSRTVKERNGRELTGRHLTFFATYGILEPHRESDWFLLANQASVELGWAPAANGILWPTTQGIGLARFTEEDEQKNAEHRAGLAVASFPIRFYKTLDELRRDQNGDVDAPQPVAMIDAPRSEPAKFMKWPVLEEKSIVIRGKKTRAFKVCLVGYEDPTEAPATALAESPFAGSSFAGAPLSGIPSPGRGGPISAEEYEKAAADVLQAVRRLDLIVLMDMTASMRDEHHLFRDNIKRIISDLHSQNPQLDLKVGWAAYQDKLGYEHYVAKFFGAYTINDKVNQLGALKARIGSTKLLGKTSVDHEECVFHGMHTALTEFAWRPGSKRVLIVAGDAPNHAKGAKKNVGRFGVKDMVALCDQKHVHPYVIHSTCAHGLQLAKQIQYVADHVRHSDSAPSGQHRFAVNNAQRFLGEVTRMINTAGYGVQAESERAEELIGVHDPRRNLSNVAEIKPQDLTTVVRILRGRPHDQLGPKFDMIISVLEGTQRVDKEVKAGVVSAWIPEAIDGMQIVESYELISKVNVRRIQDYLRDLQSLRGENVPEKLAAARYAEVFGQTSDITRFLQSGSASEMLDDYLKRRHRISFRTALLSMSKEDFLSMPASERIEKVNLAAKYDDFLQDVRTNYSMWHRMGEEEYAWLPSRALP